MWNFFFTFLFRFLSKSTSEIRIKPKKVGFDAALVSKAAWKVRKPRLEFLFLLFFRFLAKLISEIRIKPKKARFDAAMVS